MISNRERRSREVRDLTTLMASIELPFLRFKNHFHRGGVEDEGSKPRGRGNPGRMVSRDLLRRVTLKVFD